MIRINWKLLFFIFPITLPVIAAQNEPPATDAKTLQSLDAITAQSSGVPALLLIKPIALPEPARRASGKPAHPKKQTSPSHPSQSSAASQESSQQLATLRASWEQEKAALQKKPLKARRKTRRCDSSLRRRRAGRTRRETASHHYKKRLPRAHPESQRFSVRSMN